MKLITLADFQKYKRMTQNMDLAKLDTFIEEAQMLDLRPLSGDALYFDLITDNLVPRNVDLLTGKSYIYNGNNITFAGLKPVLVYFTYARYAAMTNIIDTASGLVYKDNDFSTPAASKDIARVVDQAKSAAIAYWGMVEQYLNVSYELYPLWKSNHCGESRRFKTKYSSVG